MKKIVLALLTIILFGNSYCQIKDLLNAKDFLWSEWELIQGNSEKTKFFDSLGFSLESSLADYRIVDIDGDGVADVVKTTGNAIKIYQYHKGEFRVVLDVAEELVTLTRSKPWNPINILSKDSNCCGSDTYALKNYQPGFQNGELVYFAENEIIISNSMELIHENLPPFKFKIRAVPELTASPSLGESATVLKTYNTGDYGFALASKRGTENQTWWMVLIPEDKHQFRAGWMRSKYLKRVF